MTQVLATMQGPGMDVRHRRACARCYDLPALPGSHLCTACTTTFAEQDAHRAAEEADDARCARIVVEAPLVGTAYRVSATRFVKCSDIVGWEVAPGGKKLILERANKPNVTVSDPQMVRDLAAELGCLELISLPDEEPFVPDAYAGSLLACVAHALHETDPGVLAHRARAAHEEEGGGL